MGGEDSCDLTGFPPHWAPEPSRHVLCHGELGVAWAQNAKRDTRDDLEHRKASRVAAERPDKPLSSAEIAELNHVLATLLAGKVPLPTHSGGGVPPTPTDARCESFCREAACSELNGSPSNLMSECGACDEAAKCHAGIIEALMS